MSENTQDGIDLDAIGQHFDCDYVITDDNDVMAFECGIQVPVTVSLTQGRRDHLAAALAAHVAAVVAGLVAEVESLRAHIADRLEYLRGVQKIALGYQHRYQNAEASLAEANRRLGAVAALHVPWYEIAGVRNEHRVLVAWDEAPDDHVCVIGRTATVMDVCDPGDTHAVLACAECRASGGNDIDVAHYPFYPCATAAVLGPVSGAVDYVAPCPIPGCQLAITRVGGLAPRGVCPAHGHPAVSGAVEGAGDGVEAAAEVLARYGVTGPLADPEIWQDVDILTRVVCQAMRDVMNTYGPGIGVPHARKVADVARAVLATPVAVHEQEVRAEADVLVAHAEGRAHHIWQGSCPDEMDRGARDPYCPVCAALTARASGSSAPVQGDRA